MHMILITTPNHFWDTLIKDTENYNSDIPDIAMTDNMKKYLKGSYKGIPLFTCNDIHSLFVE